MSSKRRNLSALVFLINLITKVNLIRKKYINKDIIVRDHCHFTVKYRGSAHQDCNLNYRLTEKIPVIFYNLRGYDSHFIMQNIGEIAKNTHTKTQRKRNVK